MSELRTDDDIEREQDERDRAASTIENLEDKLAKAEAERDELRAKLDGADHTNLWQAKQLAQTKFELELQTRLRITDVNALKIKGAKALSDELQAMRKRAHDLETLCLAYEETGVKLVDEATVNKRVIQELRDEVAREKKRAESHMNEAARFANRAAAIEAGVKSAASAFQREVEGVIVRSAR